MKVAQTQLTTALLLLAFFTPSARAQERSDQKKPSTRDRGRFFTHPVDLWESGLTLAEAAKKEGPSLLAPLPGHIQVRPTLWAEPIKLPDGRTVLYVPPPQVLRFLEDPTLETARAYHAFQKKRSDRMRKALLLLAKAKEEMSRGEVGDGPQSLASPTKGSRPDGSPFTLLYFHSAT